MLVLRLPDPDYGAAMPAFSGVRYSSYASTSSLEEASLDIPTYSLSAALCSDKSRILQPRNNMLLNPYGFEVRVQRSWTFKMRGGMA